MKLHMQTLISLLTKNDLEGLLKHYLACDEAENIVQLSFLFQQGQLRLSVFEFYQQIATKFIASKALPVALIARINSSDGLSFFTPALQLNNNFKLTNLQQRNVLHYLLAGDQSSHSNARPTFNYLRSMMLFESNDTLREALMQRDCQNFTPVEVYLFANKNLAVLPDHELTALLALIEIESKQQAFDETNYLPIIREVRKLCANQGQGMSSELQRLLLIATYYSKPIEQVVDGVNKA